MVVKRDGPVLEAFQQVQFVLIPFFLEVSQSISLAHFAADVGILLLGQFHHFGLDGRKVFVRDGVLTEVHVVVKTVFDGWPYPELDTGVQRLKRLGHQVGRTVPHRALAFVVAPGQQVERGIFVDAALRIPHFAVDLSGQHVAREALADAHGYVQCGRAVFDLLYRSIR